MQYNRQYDFTQGTVIDSEQIDGEFNAIKAVLNGGIDDANLTVPVADIIKTVYPVGSIYISTNSTNPATLFGIGTWTAFGAGKTLVGINAAETEFDTVEETGGEKTHKLTEPELAHISGYWSMHGQESGTMFYSLGGYATGTYYGGAYKTLGPTYGAYSYTNPGFDFGDDVAHNNLQPYIVTYMWKRTA